MKKIVCLAAVTMLAASVATAAPPKDPVAEGFMDWEGLTSKNLLMGRLLTPSDLRHKAVVYIVLDGEKLTNDKVPGLYPLASIVQMPADHLTQWETEELPRSKIVALSVRNFGGKKTPADFVALFKPPKGTETSESVKYTIWGPTRRRSTGISTR